MRDRLNIADYFLVERLEEGNGGRVALRHDGGSATYDQVNALADRYAHALEDVGVRSEERVFVALPDGPDFVGAFFGTLKRGAVVVMLNPDLPAPRIAELVELCGPAAAVIDVGALDAFTAATASAGVALVTTTGGGDLSVADVTTTEPFLTVPRHRGDPAIWLFSGGTTGVPKAVVQTHGSFVNTTELYAHGIIGYRPDDVTMSIPKLYFGYATGSNLLFPFSVGGSAVLFAEHPTPEVVFERIARHRPTILVNVPTMVAKLVGHPKVAEQDVTSLRLSTSAGEALPPELHRSWNETFGVELLDGLGTAEMWHIFISNAPGRAKPGTLGKPVPGFDVKVCDPDGEEVPDGEIGELWVRGASLATGYWNDPGRTHEAFRGDWFVGGDLVKRDHDGYIEHHGRADDRLKVGGKWLAPQEVESCLLEHDAVDEAVVVGVANEAGLIKPVAFVIAKEGYPDIEAELMALALERLEPYKHPRRVIVVDEWPTTHLGKVDRTRLKEMAAA